MPNIEQFIKTWEGRIAAHQAKTKIETRISALIDQINEGDSEIDQEQYLKIVSQLSEVLERMQREQQMSYEEISAEGDAIYGDQSKNDTFYFNRKSASPTAQELAPLFAELPSNYTLPMPPKVLNIGDQSKNENLYIGRREASQKKR